VISPICSICLEKFELGDRVTACTPQGQETIWLCEVCADEMRRAFRERDLPYYDADLDRVGPFSGRRGISLSGNSTKGRGRVRKRRK